MATHNPENVELSLWSVLQQWSQPIELITKSAAVALAVCYLVGLLVVNIYLWSLGISEFSLLKVRFVYTGAVVLIWLSASLILSVLAVLIASVSKEAEVEHVWVRRLQRLMYRRDAQLVADIILWVGAFSYPLWLGNRVLSGAYLPIHWPLIRVLLPTYGRLLLVVACLILLASVMNGLVDRFLFIATRNDRRMYLAVLTFSTLLAFFGYVRSFSHRIYPVLPEQAGGGKPRDVQIVFSPDHASIMKSLGIPVCEPLGISSRVRLMFDSDNGVVVESRGKIVQLRKEMVDGIRITDENCGSPQDQGAPRP